MLIPVGGEADPGGGGGGGAGGGGGGPKTWLRIVVVLLILSAALFVILAHGYDDADRKWAYGAIGAILGYVIGQA